MSYCTIEQYKTAVPTGYHELVQLTDQNDLGQIDEAVFDAAAEYAANVINSILSGLYADRLPLDPVPANIVPLAVDITRWRLHRDDIPDSVQAFYDAAILWLEEIGSGERPLDPVPAEPESSREATFNISSESKRFSRSQLKDF